MFFGFDESEDYYTAQKALLDQYNQGDMKTLNGLLVDYFKV